MTKEDKAEKSMTKEERAKIEKIAMEDISKVISKLSSEKSKAISEYKDVPSQEVKDLFEKWKKVNTELEMIRKKLSSLDYDINGYGGNKELCFKSYGNKNKEFTAIAKKWEDKIDQANGLKREVIVNLYTSGTGAREFLTKLGEQLAKLLN